MSQEYRPDFRPAPAVTPGQQAPQQGQPYPPQPYPPQPYPSQPYSPQPYPPQQGQSYPQQGQPYAPQQYSPQPPVQQGQSYPQQGYPQGPQQAQPYEPQQGYPQAPQQTPQPSSPSGVQQGLQQLLQQGIQQIPQPALQQLLQQGLQQLPQQFVQSPQQQSQPPVQSLAPHVSNPQQLYAQTQNSAARMYTAVAHQYLQFRSVYFGETNPSLATTPPLTDAIQQTEPGKIADRGLHLMPHAVRELPLVRELMDHLQWEVDIHTLTSRERTALHNLAMVFLYGTDGGIQAWYVDWLLDQMHRIEGVTHPKYYLAYPWQGLLYRSPHDLTTFDNAVQTGNVPEIEHHVEHYAGQLIMVLRDPLATQPKLAFSGAHGEERHMLFTLKTSAAIALGAYLAVEAVRDLMGHHHTHEPPQSVLAPFPPQITQHMLPDAPLPGDS